MQRLRPAHLIVFVILVACLPRSVYAESPSESVTPSPRPPSSVQGVREFSAGVRIDWQGLTVEVDAEVVLREGPLELLACSPNTREHESILRVPARPLHIYQAMGLIGLEPGGPLAYDEVRERWKPAYGQSLELRVRCGPNRGVPETPVQRWLLTMDGKEVSERIDWVFAGSESLDSGRFAADQDGTVVCLVDFSSALIAVGALHSADNEQLWLRANPKTIPPRGTGCTLLIRSANRVYHIELASTDEIRHEGRVLSRSDLVRLVEPLPQDDRDVQLHITRLAGVTDEAVNRITAYLRERNFRGVIEAREKPKDPAPGTPRTAPLPADH